MAEIQARSSHRTDRRGHGLVVNLTQLTLIK